jgi:flagellar assembly protein FliH
LSERTAHSGAERWQAPSIDGVSTEGFPTASQLEALQKQAHDEAWQAGHAEGLEAGRAEIERRAARFDALLTALAEPFAALDETVERRLVELATTVVEQLLRRELQADPAHVAGVVREALAALPAGSRNVAVHLHPDDAALVAEQLAETHGERAWSIVEDPSLTRGGCTVTTHNAQIDARVETRLERAAEIVGDQTRR